MRDQQQKGKDESKSRVYWRLLGILFFPLALFPLLSIITYDWRDIHWLHVPPLSPPANLIGLAGAWSTFIGYTIFGIAFWILPFLIILVGTLLLLGQKPRFGRKLFWMVLFMVALCALVQLGSENILADALERLNMRPNAGGAIGYAIMTCVLARWFSPVGGGLMALSVMLGSLVLAVGIHNTTNTLLNFFGKIRRRLASERSPVANDPDSKLTTDEERARRQALKETAKRAREEAKQARREERRRQKEATSKASGQSPDIPPTLDDVPVARGASVERLRREAALQKKIELARQAAAAARAKERQPAAAPPLAPQNTTPTDRPLPTPRKQEEGEESVAVRPYELPPLDLLEPLDQEVADHGDLEYTRAILVETLAQFNVPVEVVGTTPGPVVTQYELRPAPNIKVERIASLTANLQMALAANSLRIQAPIPGKNAVGIEVPNRKACKVTFREVLESTTWTKNRLELPMLFGKDVAGRDLLYDLTRAPHLLIAGSTGSGKSVCLNAIINGFLMSRTPEQLRLILVDPKRVEFTEYNDLPHLLVPVINDPKKVAFGLRWAIIEMDKRYRMLQRAKCRDIVAFNNRETALQEELFNNGDLPEAQSSHDDLPDKLPYIVLIVDEVADIMAVAGKEVEPAIARLASLSRAVGIHMILATQRPSVDVITGTIKANIPGRIAFKVSQSNDSRTILDTTGAEELIGKGDLLFLREGAQLIRAQGALVTDPEISRIVRYIKENNQPNYDQSLSRRLDKIKEDHPESSLDEELDGEMGEESQSAPDADDQDVELLNSAIEVIRMTQRASTTMLQRRLRIGYTRAARLMDTLEERGIVGPPAGSNVRDILVDLDRMLPENPAVEAVQKMEENKEETGA